jgi:hypothetical protein
MDRALGIDFWVVRAWSWSVGKLGSGEDVEVIVGSVAACMTFCADCGSCERLVGDENE